MFNANDYTNEELIRQEVSEYPKDFQDEVVAIAIPLIEDNGYTTAEAVSEAIFSLNSIKKIPKYQVGNYVKVIDRGYIGKIEFVTDDGHYVTPKESGGIWHEEENLELSSKEEYEQRQKDRRELFDVLYFDQQEIIEMSQSEYDNVLHILQKNNNLYKVYIYKAYRTNNETMFNLANKVQKLLYKAMDQEIGLLTGDHWAGLDIDTMLGKAFEELKKALNLIESESINTDDEAVSEVLQ
ncbi:hypothetical protein [Aquamicrobium sp.]|uniref:hypothetical protein n=1 Tax=Aquamicrobium sp. TaxID=1872579 RepID=UPI002589ED80|nr:hypothetical protein [Aquamicrobium sp.]MCK9553197.1 hypothetical protein [Aquamicrobium sp.]